MQTSALERRIMRRIIHTYTTKKVGIIPVRQLAPADEIRPNKCGRGLISHFVSNVVSLVYPICNVTCVGLEDHAVTAVEQLLLLPRFFTRFFIRSFRHTAVQ